MSKFYAAESSSDTEETSSSEDEIKAPNRKPTVQKRFLLSEDEEETTHVVLSAKEKAWEGFNEIIKQMMHARKNKDVTKLLDEFENICKFHNKMRAVILKEGTPRFYIRCMVETQDFVNELWQNRDAKKRLSKLGTKSLNILRQKIRKYLRDFEKEVDDYRSNPDVDVEDESSDDDVAEEEELPLKASTFLSEPLKAAEIHKPSFVDVGDSYDDDDDDDGDEWLMSSSDDESSSDDSDTGALGGRQLTAEYFLKKTVTADTGEKAKKKDRVQTQQQRDAKAKKKEEQEESWEQVKGVGKIKTKLFEKGIEIDHEVVLKKLVEITLNRGRRSTVRRDQVEMLKQLRQISEENQLGVAMSVRILFDLISGLFDYNTKMLDCMKPEPWKEVTNYVDEVLNLLLANPHITVAEHLPVESENLSDKEAGYRLHGNPVVLVEKMHSEYIKVLQNADAHSTDYLKYLKEEPRVVKIIKKLKSYCEQVGSTQFICRAYLLLIEYIYYKYDRSALLSASKVEGSEKSQDSFEVMKTLCQYIYAKDSSDRLRTRAILFHIYHHSLHDRWYEARDLMLMSHLQEMIDAADIPTRIIYNRTMVQLGLCAFRRGFMKEAHHALVDIQSTGRAKELLAQGLLLQRQGERISPEQEKIEKRRQIPFHMHINLELLECVYLVSAMLLEIPYVASHEFDARRRMISKQFHHQLRVSERQALLGPPENMREHVVAAAKALKMGDYRSCLDYIINDKMNSKIWNLFANGDEVRKMLETKIKEESLCTYLFTYSQFYDNISLDWLSSMFDLDRTICHQIVSRLIINEELAASWDEPSSSLVLHRTDPTRLQNMAIQLAEKVSTLVEVNERILESKAGAGNFTNYRQDNYQSGGFQSKSGRQGGYQGGRQGSYQSKAGSNYQVRSGYQGRSGFANRGYQNNYIQDINKVSHVAASSAAFALIQYC